MCVGGMVVQGVLVAEAGCVGVGSGPMLSEAPVMGPMAPLMGSGLYPELPGFWRWGGGSAPA